MRTQIVSSSSSVPCTHHNSCSSISVYIPTYCCLPSYKYDCSHVINTVYKILPNIYYLSRCLHYLVCYPLCIYVCAHLVNIVCTSILIFLSFPLPLCLSGFASLLFCVKICLYPLPISIIVRRKQKWSPRSSFLSVVCYFVDIV